MTNRPPGSLSCAFCPASFLWRPAAAAGSRGISASPSPDIVVSAIMGRSVCAGEGCHAGEP